MEVELDVLGELFDYFQDLVVEVSCQLPSDFTLRQKKGTSIFAYHAIISLANMMPLTTCWDCPLETIKEDEMSSYFDSFFGHLDQRKM